MLSLVFSSNVFAAEEKSKWDSFLNLFNGAETSEVKGDIGVEYRGHIENTGDFPLDKNEWVSRP